MSAGGAGTAVIGGSGTGSVVIQYSNVVTYPDITFYDKMDSSTTGRAPTKGSGTLTITSNIVPAAALSSSSTASLYGNLNAAFKHIAGQVSGNMDLSVGRAGFYFEWDTATNNASTAFGWVPSGDASPRFAFRKGNSGSTWSFKYEDVSIDKTLTAGTTYYVEVAWDHSKTHGYCAGARIDGGTMTTSNSCTASVPTMTSSFGLMGDATLASGTSLNGKMDEVIISSDSTRDLYAIRDLGSYPN